MTYRPELHGMIRFSRLAQQWATAGNNPLTEAIAAHQGLARIDLVTANPHQHGLEFPADTLRQALDDALASIRVYRPDPRGQWPAREAVAAWYRRRAFEVRPEDVVLTPGTSLSYFYLLRLLLNPGDEVLVPRPGYPLFEDLVDTAGVKLRYYHLRPTPAGWAMDLSDLEFQCTARTRVLMVVSPHNPLGTVVTEAMWQRLGELCRRHHLVLVLDEVFSEFVPDGFARPQAGDFPLLCILNGFSKMFSLPGYKLGWTAVVGDADLRDKLVTALEYLSDVFLPVSELAQAAAPAILAAGDAVSIELAHQYRIRRDILQEMLTLVPAAGGVYACLALPAGLDEDEAALQALQQASVLVHPGHFYQLPGHLVMTCVAGPDHLRDGGARLRRLLDDLRLRLLP